MKAATTKSVNMKYKALYSYVINTNYRCISGVIGLGISFLSLIALVVFWKSFSNQTKILLALVGLLFTVVNPIMLAWKTFKQLKLSPSYKKPIDYTFEDKGITIAQGEASDTLPWNRICRLMLTEQMLAIYTSRMHAFVIPVSELGEDRAKILTAVVQFTSQYGPKLSKSLKRFESGKGL